MKIIKAFVHVGSGEVTIGSTPFPGWS